MYFSTSEINILLGLDTKKNFIKNSNGYLIVYTILKMKKNNFISSIMFFHFIKNFFPVSTN